MNLYVVVPNWNGQDSIGSSLDSLSRQSQKHKIIVVDNFSSDRSLEIIFKFKDILVIQNEKNLGFAGGVNRGIEKAIECGAEYIALLNNDAVADKNWLKKLVEFMGQNPDVGIAASKMFDSQKKYFDSTGEYYSNWGLPFPRGRDEECSAKYDSDNWIFGASGGASIYRVSMLMEIGLFDEDFFAYYEDVDISFRAQLAGWKVSFVPEAKVYHQIGGTSRKVRGFGTMQTMKNLPWLMWKNVPGRLMLKVFPRFVLAYFAFYFSAITRGEEWPATKGMLISIFKWPKKLIERYRIQKHRKVSVEYIESILVHDLPPNAHKLRKLRNMWWKLIKRNAE